LGVVFRRRWVVEKKWVRGGLLLKVVGEGEAAMRVRMVDMVVDVGG
jgi:hypothetical protein